MLMRWIRVSLIVLMLTIAASRAARAQAPACGNGMLETGESCEACATDCTIRPCLAAEPRFTVKVAFVPPAAGNVSSATVRLSYRSDVVSLPGRGADASVRERVSGAPSETFSAVNDLGYGLRVVITHAGSLSAGPLFTVAFDACQNAPAPALTDLACVVEACGGQKGASADCGCTVATP